MAIILRVDELVKHYPGTPVVKAVDKISFQLKEKEILGLLGPNGSGKTTTIQMLLGTLTPTSGSVVYFGKDFYAHRTEILQNISFASTYTSLPYVLTIEENLIVFGALYGLSKKESCTSFCPLLERFGILDKLKHNVSALSAGQVTRLMLVKAFFMRPKIVLLDEPTASLDPDMAADICSFLLEQREKFGTSILFSSHKMNEVMEICDRTIFLKEGKIVADDLPVNLARSASAFKIRLTVIDGIKRTQAIAEAEHLHYSLEHRVIELYMDEEKIPYFLHKLSHANINYSSIHIDEPSLETYFLQLTKKARPL